MYITLLSLSLSFFRMYITLNVHHTALPPSLWYPLISSLARTSCSTGFWLNLNCNPCKIKFSNSNSLHPPVFPTYTAHTPPPPPHRHHHHHHPYLPKQWQRLTLLSQVTATGGRGVNSTHPSRPPTAQRWPTCRNLSAALARLPGPDICSSSAAQRSCTTLSLLTLGGML